MPFGVANPVEVLTKSAPAFFAHKQHVSMAVSSKKHVSKMVFTRIVLPFLFPSCFIAFTTSKISVPTSENLPSFAAPIFITISISSAPFAIAFKDSFILSFVVTAPKGKPTTVQVFIFESLSSVETVET